MYSLLLHSASAFYMTGVIWFAQVIQYPLLRLVDKDRYKEYYDIHLSRIVRIVLPVIVLQLATAAYLFFDAHYPLWFSGALLTYSIFNFCYTAYISVSIYREMAFAYSDELIERLLGHNWVRTIVWTMHSLTILIGGFYLRHYFL
ncbi:MAG: hypothetical protein JSU04_04560 [Bdellovibrionales bacterium]|nr:hypothetical protein [Bdellovibrionales bacterium]